jgi:hypothetical protein
MNGPSARYYWSHYNTGKARGNDDPTVSLGMERDQATTQSHAGKARQEGPTLVHRPKDEHLHLEPQNTAPAGSKCSTQTLDISQNDSKTVQPSDLSAVQTVASLYANSATQTFNQPHHQTPLEFRQSISSATRDGAGRSYPHQDPATSYGQGDRGHGVSSSGQPPEGFDAGTLQAQYQPPGKPNTPNSASPQGTYIPQPSFGFTHPLQYKNNRVYDGGQSYDEEDH